MIKKLFKPSENYAGVLPIQVYVMKLFFALMFLVAAKDAWSKLLWHTGAWDPKVGIAWCAIAAYTTLSGLGIFQTLRMLPVMLFMYFYKGLWLYFVAYPLWKTGQLAGTETGDWSQIFILIVIPIIFTPWKYVYKTFVLGKTTLA